MSTSSPAPDGTSSPDEVLRHVSELEKAFAALVTHRRDASETQDDLEMLEEMYNTPVAWDAGGSLAGDAVTVKEVRFESLKKHFSSLPTKADVQICIGKLKAKLKKLEDNLKKLAPFETAHQSLAQCFPQHSPSDWKLNRLLCDRMRGKEYHGAESVETAVTAYLGDVLAEPPERNSDNNEAWGTDGRSLIWCIDPQWGYGKTRLQNELCFQDSVRIKLKMGTSGADISSCFIRVTFNEKDRERIHGISATIFGQNALMCNGLPAAEATKVNSLRAAMDILRRKLTDDKLLVDPPGSKALLCVCVDELHQMSPHASEALDPENKRLQDFAEMVNTLMRFQDRSLATNQPVVFFFTSLSTELLQRLSSAYGRSCAMCDVPVFRPVDAEKCGLKNGASTRAGKLLFTLAALRPKALEGLPKALIRGFDVSDALRQVMDASGIGHNELHLLADPQVLLDWIGKGTFTNLQKLQDHGVIVPTYWGQAVNPFHARAASKLYRSQSPVFEYLDSAYTADLQAKASSEKSLESVLVYLEATKRLSFGSEPISLADYYVGGVFHNGLGDETVSCFRDSKTGGVEYLPDLTDVGKVIKHLRRGDIVVSDKANETGIEYLVPFFGTGEMRGEMRVAFVQVKFGPTYAQKTKITEVVRKITSSALHKAIVNACESIAPFIVDFTIGTSDPAPRDDCVLYNEDRLRSFTSRMGPLHFHVAKADETHTYLSSWTGQCLPEEAWAFRGGQDQ